ncbi:ATP-binding protein, partial [Ferrovibrio sp.]|uniref:PAS domain-containing sensor histidine kinase n=1 Tax=Ferrovibrio sp. TaxID=1917215 RepID=UPI00311F3186
MSLRPGSDDPFMAALGRHDDSYADPAVPAAAGSGAGASGETLLLQALDSIGEGFAVWDAGPNLIRFNRQMPALFGLSADDLRPGLPAQDFLALLIERGALTIRAEEAEAWIEAYIDASTKADRKQEVRLADGTWLNFDWRRLQGGGFVAVFTDITLRKRAQIRLRQAEAKYRQIFDNVHEGIIQVTPEGRVLAVNQAGAAIFGFHSPEEMLATVTRAGDQLYVNPDRRRDLLLQLERHGHARDFRSEMRRRDGSVIWVSKTLRLVADDRGSPVMIEGMFRDISAQRRAEQQLMQAKEQAEAANRAKSDFLANMSHELRTPLNAILGFSQVLQEEMMGPLGNPKYREYCRDIVQSGEHLLALIGDILDMAKVESGKMHLDEDWIDLEESLEAGLLLVRERATANRIAIRKTMPQPMASVWADSRRLRQVWINLLSNAVKFTPQGGWVEVTAAWLEGGALSVTVADSGIGIASEDIERVQQPFSQVANALSRGHEGTGLGLSLSRNLVELHGGSLDLDSRLGEGTTVTVTLPAERCRRGPLAAAQHQL